MTKSSTKPTTKPTAKATTPTKAKPTAKATKPAKPPVQPVAPTTSVPATPPPVLTPTLDATDATTTTNPAKAKPAKTKPAKPKRVSALDAAVQVLQQAGKPMTTPELVAAMKEQKLWVSPNGKTPHATLHAAISTEIKKKGTEARFRKADRGHFTLA